MTHANKRLLILHSDFHQCPFTREILISPKHDDKTLCNCGLTSPPMISMGHREAPGVHIKKFLEVATVNDYIEQQQRLKKGL